MNRRQVVVVVIVIGLVLIAASVLVSIEMSPMNIHTRYRAATNHERDPETLRFNAGDDDETFTIIQFADLHYGESSSMDNRSTGLMLDILQIEKGIDFAVLSGDQISGFTRLYNKDRFMLWISSLIPTANNGIPFATIMGNHDDQPYYFNPVAWFVWTQIIAVMFSVVMVLVMCFHLTDRKRIINSTTIPLMLMGVVVTALVWSLYQLAPSTHMRESLLRYEKSQFPTLSRTVLGPSSLPGVSNYYIPVFSSRHNEKVLLFFLDSGGGRLPETILPSQTEWVRSVSEQYGKPHAIAFFHIPSDEFTKSTDIETNTFDCVGHDKTETPCTFSVGDGTALSVTSTLAAAGVRAVFVGHDHRNSWCCVPKTRSSRFDMASLCYGRHTGYGGYGDWLRGARVIQLRFDASPTPRRFTITTWLRLENGEKEMQGQIFPFPDSSD